VRLHGATFVKLAITAATVDQNDMLARAFSQAAPSVWNDLPIKIRNFVTFCFRSALRTHYCGLAVDSNCIY